ncbi:MAG: UPF0175 family protein [Candidatus Natronoplasma sp.]
MSKAKRVSMTLPEIIKREVDAIPETGYYDSRSEFLRDAIRTLLRERPELRVSLACKLYENGEISLGRAMEIAEEDIESMKDILESRGIDLRRGSESVDEMEKAVEEWEE